MRQGGTGAGDKRAKVLPACRAFLFLPSSGEPWGRSCLGWCCSACPALTLGKMPKAASCSLHPKQLLVPCILKPVVSRDLPGVVGPEATVGDQAAVLRAVQDQHVCLSITPLTSCC